ncbi:MAG: rhodanese-like domain-containing protein [Spirochaetales bacterium]|nr:rhodanese-like domain-containing protein [Spirochaetales bacterium]
MGAYPGAVNIPLDDLEFRIEELGDKDRDVTLYCASGARSSYGQRILESSGFRNITNGSGVRVFRCLFNIRRSAPRQTGFQINERVSLLNFL